jgi:hypothetical protein
MQENLLELCGFDTLLTVRPMVPIGWIISSITLERMSELVVSKHHAVNITVVETAAFPCDHLRLVCVYNLFNVWAHNSDIPSAYFKYVRSVLCTFDWCALSS